MDKHTLAPPLRHTRAKAPMHPLAAALHVAALLWMLLSQSVHAGTVTLTLPNTIPANADYRRILITCMQLFQPAGRCDSVVIQKSDHGPPGCSDSASAGSR